MAQALQGSAQIIEFSEDNTTWKYLVCVKTIKHDGKANTTTVPTNCGVFIGVGTPEWTWSVEGVIDPLRVSTTQLSYRDVSNYLNNGTTLYIRWKSVAAGSVTAGQGWNETMQCLISGVGQVVANGDLAQFTVDIAGQGANTII